MHGLLPSTRRHIAGQAGRKCSKAKSGQSTRLSTPNFHGGRPQSHAAPRSVTQIDHETMADRATCLQHGDRGGKRPILAGLWLAGLMRHGLSQRKYCVQG